MAMPKSSTSQLTILGTCVVHFLLKFLLKDTHKHASVKSDMHVPMPLTLRHQNCGVDSVLHGLAIGMSKHIVSWQYGGVYGVLLNGSVVCVHTWLISSKEIRTDMVCPSWNGPLTRALFESLLRHGLHPRLYLGCLCVFYNTPSPLYLGCHNLHSITSTCRVRNRCIG